MAEADAEKAVGRPSIDVSEDGLLFLKRLNYSWTKISDILGISRSRGDRHLQNCVRDFKSP